jgi:hypothetical protein
LVRYLLYVCCIWYVHVLVSCDDRPICVHVSVSCCDEAATLDLEP